MAKTIHTLAYMVTADTRQFTQGMVLTKNELKATKEVIEATRGPFRQFGMEVNSLSELHRKGAISTSQYAQSLTQLVAGHGQGIPIIGSFFRVIASGNPAVIAATAAMVAMAVATGGIAAATAYSIVKIREQIGLLDDLFASSKKLGISATSFQTIGHAAKLADIEIGAVTSGIESMAKAISKATFGKGGSAGQAKTAFQLLGLDPASLRAAKPEQQLQTIVDALGKMTNQADKTRVALAIFGSADFLRLDASQLAHATELLANLNAEVSTKSELAFGRFDDASEDMHKSLDVTWKKITFAVIPALGDMGEAITRALIDLNRSKGFAGALNETEDILRGVVAVASELPGVINSWSESLGKFNAVARMTPPGALLAIAGRLVSDVGDLGEHLRISSELDAKMRDLEKKREVVGKDEAERLREEAEAAKDLAAQMDRVAEAQQRAYQSGLDLVGSLAKEIATFGMTAREVALYNAMLSSAGLIEISFAYALGKTLDKMEARKKLTDEMAAALKAARTPEEVFIEEVKKLREAMLTGIITTDEYIKLRNKAAEGLGKRSDRPSGVNPMMEGSSAAEAFLAEVRVRGTGKEDTAKEMVKILASIDKHIVEEKPALVMPRLGAAR